MCPEESLLCQGQACPRCLFDCSLAENSVTHWWAGETGAPKRVAISRLSTSGREKKELYSFEMLRLVHLILRLKDAPFDCPAFDARSCEPLSDVVIHAQLVKTVLDVTRGHSGRAVGVFVLSRAVGRKASLSIAESSRWLQLGRRVSTNSGRAGWNNPLAINKGNATSTSQSCSRCMRSSWSLQVTSTDLRKHLQELRRVVHILRHRHKVRRDQCVAGTVVHGPTSLGATPKGLLPPRRERPRPGATATPEPRSADALEWVSTLPSWVSTS